MWTCLMKWTCFRKFHFLDNVEFFNFFGLKPFTFLPIFHAWSIIHLELLWPAFYHYHYFLFLKDPTYGYFIRTDQGYCSISTGFEIAHFICHFGCWKIQWIFWRCPNLQNSRYNSTFKLDSHQAVASQSPGSRQAVARQSPGSRQAVADKIVLLFLVAF